MPFSEFLERFRLRLLATSDSLLSHFLFSRPVSRSKETVSACRICFVTKRLARTFVSVEQVSVQETPTSSPDKTYTSLRVATPRTLGQPIATESPDVRPLQIDEEPIAEGPVTSPTIEISSGSHKKTPLCEETLLTTSETADPKVDSCSNSMDPPLGGLTQDFCVDPNTPGTSQIPSPLFGQFVQQAGKVVSNLLISQPPYIQLARAMRVLTKQLLTWRPQ